MAASKAAKTRDPKGGLTAAGRAAFKRKEGANLKPGVKKTMSEMTPDEMRRKGSWAARFYGRETLPPLTRQERRADPLRAQRRRLGRAGAEDRGRGAQDRRQGRAPARALSPAQGQGLRSKVLAPEGCSLACHSGAREARTRNPRSNATLQDDRAQSWLPGSRLRRAPE